MVRPRKIPKNFIPVEWSDTDSESGASSNGPIEPVVAEPHLPDNEPDCDQDSDPDDDPNSMEFEQCMEEPLVNLAKEWLLIEMSHVVSKAASDQFWKAAQNYITENFSKTRCKNESFTHLRRQLVKKYCPKVSLDLAYKDTKTGEICIQEDVTKISKCQFPKPAFEPLYEIASVKVRQILLYI